MAEGTGLEPASLDAYLFSRQAEYQFSNPSFHCGLQISDCGLSQLQHKLCSSSYFINPQSEICNLQFTARPGLEPELRESKSPVLPLDHQAIELTIGD